MIIVNIRYFVLWRLEYYWIAFDNPQFYPEGRNHIKGGWFWRVYEPSDRNGLIGLYETQLEDAGPFMTIVLGEALRKLKETQLDPKKIEDWVVRLEKNWRTV